MYLEGHVCNRGETSELWRVRPQVANPDCGILWLDDLTNA